MNCKKVVVLSLCLSTLLLTLAYSAVVGATSEERRIVYSTEYFNGLSVTIEAPYQAYPGDNITVTVRVEASGNVYVEYIYVSIYALRNETEEFQLAEFPCVEKSDLVVSHQVDYTVTIPNNTSPGLTYGVIRWEWTYMGITVAPPPAGFTVTYVRNLELEDLQEAYDELNATYHSLLANCTELEDYKGELGATRNLMYIFVATTVVSAATVFVLLMRRPKRLWS
jgi:hypothetical protein